MRLAATLALFFDDPRRKPLRQRKKRSFFLDYLFWSEVNYYSRLRYLVNFIIGILVSSVLYYIAWVKLNFADFYFAYGVIVKWFIILGIAFVFTYSPICRCATICLVCGAIGKNGQLPLSMLLFNNLHDGPIDSIVSNFRLTSDAVLCNLQMQAQIAVDRVSLLSQPLETMIENSMIRGVEMGKRMVKKMKSIFNPFGSDFTDDETEEDNALKDSENAANVMAKREEIMRERGVDNVDDKESEDKKVIGKMKTELGKKIMNRVARRCDEVFNRGLHKCHETFGGLKYKCLAFGIVGFLVCNHLDPAGMCEDSVRKAQSRTFCKKKVEGMEGGNSFEELMLEMNNASKGVENELKMNIHIAAMEMPRFEFTLALSDVKTKVRGGVLYVKVLMKTIKEVAKTLLIFMVYSIFRDAIRMISNYRSNVEFNNRFITRRFWEIDDERAEEGKITLNTISKKEWKEMKLLNVFGPPTKAELSKAQRPLINWFITLFFVVIIIIMDRYVYKILSKLIPLTIAQTNKGGSPMTSLQVQGKGEIVNILNSIVAINIKGSNRHFSNDQCQFEPIKTDDAFIFTWIICPLLFMLVLQVLFNFIIKRALLFYVLPFMFPRRDQVRMIYLYNKILFTRLKNREQARARIRFIADRWMKNEEMNDGGLFSNNSWFKRKFLDRIFTTGECIYCRTRMGIKHLIACPDCPSTYCEDCVDELKGDCYACLAQEGLVTSIKSQLESIKESHRSKKEKRKEDKSQ